MQLEIVKLEVCEAEVRSQTCFKGSKKQSNSKIDSSRLSLFLLKITKLPPQPKQQLPNQVLSTTSLCLIFSTCKRKPPHLP